MQVADCQDSWSKCLVSFVLWHTEKHWRLKGVVEHVCSSQLQQEDKHRERSPREVFCSMRSLYQGTEPSMTSCIFWLKPLSWLRMRMMMSSMYNWLGVLYEVLCSLHSNAKDDVKCSVAKGCTVASQTALLCKAGATVPVLVIQRH